MMDKPTSRDYIAALDAVSVEDDDAGIVYTDEDPEVLSEAERAAGESQGPRTRSDGTVVGTPGWKPERPLTSAQMAFAQGVIEGKSLRQSYRDAYPNAQASDQSISASAARLRRDSRIARVIQDAWEQTQEALADDLAATQRYVMRRLVELSKTAEREGDRLKALDLLGRGAGLWRDKPAQQAATVSAEDLKRQLAGHLRIVASKRKGAA